MSKSFKGGDLRPVSAIGPITVFEYVRRALPSLTYQGNNITPEWEAWVTKQAEKARAKAKAWEEGKLEGVS